jgi:Protein of unknown function (DUF4058)
MGLPFPGMDLYIEACHFWEDFHYNVVLEIKGVLASRLPDRFVVRAGERAYVVMSPFNRPLPPIDFPLLDPDPDIALDLQPLMERIYGRSRYERDIDYSQPISRR